MNTATTSFLKQLETGAPTPTMPVAFIGHGNPMNTINNSVFAHEWNRMSSLIPRPRAIVVMSAHWLSRGLRVTAMPQPQTIHDFYGFPQELYDIQYPAPGSPDLASATQSFINHIELDHDWGLDHGAWTVLAHMYPDASIPVVQLSVDMHSSLEELYNTVSLLRPLRERGVLFMGSGNIVHNLGLVNFNPNPTPADWALEFDATSKELIENRNIQPLIDYASLGSAAQLAIPSEDHYRPMIMTLALTNNNEKITFFNESIDAATVSMRSFILSPE